MHLTPTRTPYEMKINTPSRTLTTQAESYFKSMYSNVSNDPMSTPHLAIYQNSQFNSENANGQSYQINYHHIQQLLKEMKSMLFLSEQVLRQKEFISKMNNNIIKLKAQREQLEYRIKRGRKKYYSRQKTLSNKKQRISSQQKEKRMSINSRIQLLKQSIIQMKSSCLNTTPKVTSKNNSRVNIDIGDQKSHYKKHRRFKTEADDLTRSRIKYKKNKIYVPVLYNPYIWTDRSIPKQSLRKHQQYSNLQQQENELTFTPEMRHRNYTDYQTHQHRYTQLNYTDHSDILPDHHDETLMNKINHFNDRLEGALQKRNSDLEYSNSKRSKKSSTNRDKGSYIYPSLINSKTGSDLSKSRQRKDSIKLVENDERERQPQQSNIHQDSSQIRSGSGEGFISYPHLKRKKTNGKGSSIPIIQEINNSTVYVQMPSQRRENESFQKSLDRKHNDSSKGSDKKVISEQSVVHMDTKVLSFLQNSPIKQEIELTQSPFRIMAKDQKLGESVPGDIQFQIKSIQPSKSKVMSNNSVNLKAEPSVSSKYEDTPRKKEMKSNKGSNDDNILEVKINKGENEGQNTLRVEQDDDQDIINTIKLSTQSIFSKGKTHLSTNSYIKNAHIPEEQPIGVSVSDIKDSKRTKKVDHDTIQDRELDVLQELRSTTPSRILKSHMVKHKFKGGSQLMSNSITEVNQEEQEALSSKKIIHPQNQHRNTKVN